ncbi:MAG TPA: hypothetical protein V6D50_16195 [Chroococcales cyanobacterium]
MIQSAIGYLMTQEGNFLTGNREQRGNEEFSILAEIPLELGTSPHEERVVGALVAGLNPPPYALTVARFPFPVAFKKLSRF